MRKYVGPILALVAGIAIGSLGDRFVWKPKEVPAVKATPVVETVKPTAPAPAPTVVVDSACKDRTYTAVEGDTLIGIAKKQYGGRSYLYRLLAEKNNVKNPNLILTGQTLVIPCSICDLAPLPEKVVEVKKVAVKTAKKETKKVVQKAVVPVATPPPAPVPAPVAQPAPAPAPAVVPPAVPAPVPPPAPAPPAPQKEVRLVVIPETAPVEKPKSSDIGEVNIGKVKSEVKPVRTAPGSMWNSLGVSPIERGNKVDYFHVDQGVILGTLPGRVLFEPYVALNATKDTKGYIWDNKVKAEAGVKLVKAFDQGVVDVSVAYATETRKGDHTSAEIKNGFIGATTGWFGWDQSSRQSRNSFLSSAPGSTWWAVGNISPFESGNVIGTVRVEQGVTLAKVKSISLLPDAWAQAGFDTQDKPWNNRYIYGGGLKLNVPWKSGVISTTAGYECAKEHGGSSSTSAICGPRVSVDIWTGWRKKIGGK